VTLRQAVIAGRLVWILCLACGHTAQIDPRELVRLQRGDRTFEELKRRTVCRRCGAKGRGAFVLNDHDGFRI
jgi:hypothetical protein